LLTNKKCLHPTYLLFVNHFRSSSHNEILRANQTPDTALYLSATRRILLPYHHTAQTGWVHKHSHLTGSWSSSRLYQKWYNIGVTSNYDTYFPYPRFESWPPDPLY